MPVRISNSRLPSPYHWLTVTRASGWPDRPAAAQGSAAPTGHPPAASGAGPVWRGRIEQPGIQAQAGDHGQPVAHGGEQLDDGIGGVRHGNEPATRQPAAGQKQQLPAPSASGLWRRPACRA